MCFKLFFVSLPQQIMKKHFKVRRYINESIKVGDSIRIIYGSGLSSIGNEMDYYIVFAYPNLTGSDKKLMHIVGTVVETGITDIITEPDLGYCYGTDIKIKLGDAEFYTCSWFVVKVDSLLTPENI